LWRGHLRLLLGRHHLVAAGLAGGICLVWMTAAVWQTGWDSFSDTVAREALQRLSPGYHREVMEQMPAHHQPALPGWAEILLHPIIILGMNLPWSAVALIALRPSFIALWDERGRRLLQTLHCWVWPNLLFWSIIPEHAPRHSFPLFPGIAGLAAMVCIAWLRGGLGVGVPRRRPTRWTSYLGPGRVLFGLLVLWLIAKLVFVHAVIPYRNADRRPRAKGEQLAAVVPAGKVLYVFQLKDEGIMFYYGRPVRRLPSPAQLPSAEEPIYCILNEAEWDRWRGTGRARALQRLSDEQGDPIVLATWLPP